VIEKTIILTGTIGPFGEALRRAHDLNESTLVLENGRPLARIVPAQPAMCTAGQLARIWHALPHLNTGDALDFADDIDRARSELLPPESKWE
jgi:antitoxin (DNA-binding transcriptional repressor) of toxin-antitoxin stability system